MRILLMNDKYRQPGATSAIVESLRAGYEKRGHAVSILTTHRVETNPEIVRDGNVVSIPVSYRPSLRHYLCLWQPRVSRMLETALRELKPDAVHAHNVHTYLTYDSLRIAASATPRVFMTAHDVMSFAYRRLATPRFLASQGKDSRLTPFDHIRAVGIQYNPLRNMLIRKALRRYVKRVLPVSAALERGLNQNGILHTTVVHNAIDTHVAPAADATVETFKKEHGLNGRRVILFGGRLGPDKGTREIIRAMRVVKDAHPDALLLVTGDAAKWEEILGREDPEDTLAGSHRCTGWLTSEALRTAFAAADVVTTPSLCLDTFNMMNIEGMLAGKPVVGTVFGGTPEIVEHGKTGFVVDPRDTDAYAGHLLTLLKDPSLARTMGKAGQERVKKEFNLETQVDRYLELLGS